MNLFIYLPNYRVIICTRLQCKYTVLPIHVDSYLSNVCHNYKKEQQEQVIKEIQQILGLIQDLKGLELFTFP
jgi:Orsellinic acid/F9775 biosynthesis cluster protein D